MFCPKCSQQQPSDEVRFCSRCGFQLEVVAELLQNGGTLATDLDKTKQIGGVLKRKEVRSGAKIIFLSFIITIPCVMLSYFFDSPIPLIIGFLTFLIGLAQILYFFIFGESILPQEKQNQLVRKESVRQLNSASEEQPIPISVFDSKPIITAELKPQLSVTEQTTNLLEHK